MFFDGAEGKQEEDRGQQKKESDIASKDLEKQRPFHVPSL
jgi:hypothetical protein